MDEKQMELAKREVRRQCCYGCIVCGTPVYTYIPIIPDNGELANIALLCPAHVARRPPLEELGHYRAQPYNMERQDNLFTFAANLDILTLEAGAQHINCDYGVTQEYCMLMIDGAPIFWIIRQDGVFFFSLRLYNQYNQMIAEILHNQVQHADNRMVINYTDNRLRLEAETALLDLSLNAAGLVIINEARLMRNGVIFQIKQEQLAINRKIPGNLFDEAYTIDNQGTPCLFMLGEAPVVMMHDENGQQRPGPLPAIFPYPRIDRYNEAGK